MNSIGILLIQLLHIYIWIVLIAVIMSWLVNFNIINPRQRLVQIIQRFLYQATEPALAPLRRHLPLLGGIDISPVVLILALGLAQNLIREYWLGMF
jgi:YggT family protein